MHNPSPPVCGWALYHHHAGTEYEKVMKIGLPLVINFIEAFCVPA